MSSFRARAHKLASYYHNDSSKSRSSSIQTTDSKSPPPSHFRSNSSLACHCSCHGSIDASVPRKTNHISRLRRSDSLSNIISALEQDGCVIIRDFIGADLSDRVHSADNSAHQSPSPPQFHLDLEDYDDRQSGFDVNELVRDSFLEDKIFKQISEHFLSRSTKIWSGEKCKTMTSHPHLSRSETHDLAIAHRQQVFHRGDWAHQTQHSNVSSYEPYRDTSLGLFVSDFDMRCFSSKSSIKIVPGSHLWSDGRPDFEDGAVDVQMLDGESLIMLGSLYYYIAGKSVLASATEQHESLLHEVWVCEGTLTPETQLLNSGT